MRFVSRFRQMGRGLAPFGLGLLIFAFGWGVGSNNISLDRLIYRDPGLNQQLPANLDYSEVERIYDLLRANFAGQLDLNALMSGLKSGLVAAAGDPFTEYLDREEAAGLAEELTGTFSGIGAELSRRGNFIIIVAPLSGLPAERAGLKPQDVIIEINGASAYGLSVSEAVRQIRGPAGTTVRLTIVRGETQRLEFEIERQQITIPSVTSEILADNIGYLRVSRFGEDTGRLVGDAAQKFKTAGVRGVILDVRNNPGGLLDASVGVASLWLNKGDKVVEERRGDVVVKTYRATGQAPLRGMPTVVLINQGSASASEIVAGALRDNGVAKLIGDKTFGKGGVQQLIHLTGGAQLKVTTARWFTPAGKNIDQAGIEPDNRVQITEEDAAAGRDPQRQAAIDFLKR